ncbi:MAG: HIT family hydrolase, diadenosine tetraphosphate hydrolase [Bacteroidetes bacterium OLB12]|nr:MAG: HIT family hydrolase, diadenosine tetraphosphate hydrolase [Bacteroidetes bacterium OLB12]HNU43167.1 HIT family protein [Cyclobacteriaceae bacterium]
MPSIFTKIINREIPAYIVAEDEHFIAFLDVMPLVEGHTLVVPKTEVDYIFDLDTTTLANLMVFAQRVAKAVKKSIPCKRIGVAVIGLEVPHTHVHLVPLNTMNDINFTMPKIKLPAETMQAVADRIKANLV